MVVWTNRASFVDGPLRIFKTICFFFVFNFAFTFFRGIAQRLPLFMLLGQANASEVNDKSAGKFVQGVRGY